jgi:hypothetical protein
MWTLSWMWDLRFSWQWSQRLLSTIWHHAVWRICAEISEEFTVTIFRLSFYSLSLQYIGKHLPDYMASHLRRQCLHFEMGFTRSITSFWNVTLCSLVDGYLCFGGTHYYHLLPWRWRPKIPQKSLYLSIKLHGVTPEDSNFQISHGFHMFFISNKQLDVAFKDFKRSCSLVVIFTALAAVDFMWSELNPFTFSFQALTRL